MAATFRIVVDASSVPAAFAVIESQSRRANRAIASDARRTTDEGARAMGGYRDAVVRSVAQRQQAEARFSETRIRLSRQAEQTVERMVEMGVTTEERAASEKERIYRQLATSYIRQEQRKTEGEAKELQKRVAAARATGAAIAQGIGRFAMGVASGVNDEYQGARQRRGGTERTLGQALYQVGGNRRDVASGMRQVQAFAAQHGMNPAELTQAVAGAQGQFSVLEGRGSLSDRLGATLETARLGRNVGADPAEFLRLQGLLNQQGMDPASQRRMLLFAAGAAQHGAVELGDLTSASLPAITRRMATANAALGANATPEQRQEAQRQAFVQSVSELEVGAAFGNRPGAAGNALANLSGALTSTNTQHKMLTNIRSSRDLTAVQRTALERSLFDEHGALRTTNALDVSERFASVAGNNPVLMANVFAGGGHGNPQGLQANWRRMMGFMTSQDANGRSGAQRIRSLMDPSTALTDADVDRGEDVFGHDTQAGLNTDQSVHDQALLDNTTALGGLSNSFTRFMAEHPVAGVVANVAGGAVASSLLGKAGAALGGAFAAPAAAAGGGAGLIGMLRAGGAWTAGAIVGAATGLGTGEAFTRGTDALAGGGAMRDHRDYLSAIATNSGNHELSRAWRSLTGGDVQQAPMTRIDPASIQQLAQALRDHPATASIDERTAQHAVATTRGAPSGETHEAHH